MIRVRKVERRVNIKRDSWEFLGAVCVPFLDFGGGFTGLWKFTIITFSAVQYKISIFFFFWLYFTIKQKRKEKRKVEQAKTKTKALSAMISVQS